MRNEHERLSGDGEIDLIELVQGIWRNKRWVGFIASPIIALGVAYSFFAQPVYEARLYVQPPSQNEIAQLNYGRGEDTGLALYSVKDVYEIYLRSLQSEGVRNKFFRIIYLPTLTDAERSGSRDALYSKFNSAIKIDRVAKDQPLRYVITASMEDPQVASDWVLGFAEMASDRAKHEMVRASESDIKMIAYNLERKIQSARASAGHEREDQVAQLEEALRIAKSVGLEMPPIISENLSSEVSASMGGSLTYMRGSKALESEIANLRSRVSDDPFIVSLRGWQQQLDFLRTMKIEPNLVSMYQLDGAVEVPDKPIKPRKALIVSFSAVLGLFFGVLAAAGRDVWSRRREVPA